MFSYQEILVARVDHGVQHHPVYQRDPSVQVDLQSLVFHLHQVDPEVLNLH